MSLPTALADLRAACKRELARLHARDWEGGPFIVYREGVLLAAWQDDDECTEVTPEFVAALKATPSPEAAPSVFKRLRGLPAAALALVPIALDPAQTLPPLGAAPLTARVATAHKLTPPPDILLIVLDDVGYQDLIAVRDAGWLPNMTALAAQGFVFGNCTASPICQPTRRTLHYGDFYARQSDDGELCAPADGLEPPAASVSSGELLASVGYSVSFLGKWHLGSNPSGPNWRGTVDVQWGTSGTAARWLPGFVANCLGNNYNSWRYVVGQQDSLSLEYQPKAMLTDFETVWPTLPRPRFACYSAQLAHSPYHRPPNSSLPAGYPPTPNDRSKYEAMIAALDFQVGKILQAVNLSETVVLVVGDNGTPEAVAPVANKAKTTTFQRGVHVPLFMAGPGIPVGSSLALVSTADIYATIAELAGVTPPAGLDSASLLPLATGAASSVHDRIAFGIQSYNPVFPHDLAARNLRYKYRRTRANDASPWTEQLYDLLVDPDELVDIAASKPALVSSLRAFVDQELP